ncbi:serine dehydratase [Anabaena sphaerica FACHB-251]|uniref:Serine dehydratase n=1 Tax=Anabaena sphaerica FACHB-251 TaxID=2692883 RepID=A0A926WLF0_9NOST|nr:serine dehydratase [Anabaena sphaerica]MBD2296760.1 serine dehydratase [Anabaena sphaerica FACHB-251]
MQLINRIFAQNSPQFSAFVSETSTLSESIYTLEDLIQTLEEAANYLAAFSESVI